MHARVSKSSQAGPFLAVAAAAPIRSSVLPPWAVDLSEGADEAPSIQRSRAERPGDPVCEAKLAKSKIAIVFEESLNGRRVGGQSRFAGAFPIVAQALAEVGLRVIPQADITAAIARAETEAYLNNDADAAIKAAGRLGARYVLHAVIQEGAARNALIRVNQVSTSMSFALQDRGRVVATAHADGASFAGQDVSAAARDLVADHAGDVVTDLYGAFCSH